MLIFVVSARGLSTAATSPLPVPISPRTITSQQLCFSAFLLGYAAFQIPAGWGGGKLGPRKTLTYG